MTYHGVTFRTATAATYLERSGLGRSGCPRCGDIPLFPEVAEFAGERCIRHTWVCEGCGHTYQTDVQLRRKSASSN